MLNNTSLWARGNLHRRLVAATLTATASITMLACKPRCPAGKVLRDKVCYSVAHAGGNGATPDNAEFPAAGADGSTATQIGSSANPGPAVGTNMVPGPDTNPDPAAAPGANSGAAPSSNPDSAAAPRANPDPAAGSGGDPDPAAAPSANPGPAAGSGADPDPTPAGRVSACPNGEPPTDEVCDNADNDCDGLLDEALTMVCGSSMMGVCQTGSQTCVNGVWGECEGAIEPTTEVCDHEKLDEDCDGTSNEDCECTDGDSAPCGKNVGACREGMQQCTDGRLGTCEGATDPEPRELCEGSIDEDCDGKTDETCECTNGDTEPCIASAACTQGTRTCSNGRWGACQGSNRCTGGQTCDTREARCVECLNGDTRPCGESSTAPCRMGTQRCTNNRWETSCQGAVLPQASDPCNGMDDDCNGRTDDGCSSGSCMQFDGETVCAEPGPSGPYQTLCRNCIKQGNKVRCEGCNGSSQTTEFQLPCSQRLTACGGDLLCLPSSHSLSMCTNIRLSSEFCSLTADCKLDPSQTNTIQSTIEVKDCTDASGNFTGLLNCGGYLKCTSQC